MEPTLMFKTDNPKPFKYQMRTDICDTPIWQMKKMGCVIDKEFEKALLEQYPNRKYTHSDQFKRKKVMSESRDIPELAIETICHKRRRCQDVPLADLSQARWEKARLNHLFGWEWLCSIPQLEAIRKAKIAQLLERNYGHNNKSQ